mgnify:CR=1 FL=1
MKNLFQTIVLLQNNITSIFLSLLFFVFSLATLADYGINWDAPSHLLRGQTYLHYYLTGRKNYTDLDQWNKFREKEAAIRTKTAQEGMPRYRLYLQKVDTIFFNPDIPKNQVPRISMYQNSGKDFNNVMAYYDYGHPHISDVLSAVFNFVLFQKLGLLNDVDSYRVYGVLLGSLLVGLVVWWTASSYGKFSGLIAALSLSLYPLFWSESHFNNEKDIPETVFYTFFLFSFWKGITGKSWKWILASGLFFGLALGTKFNVLFSIFVILPWLIAYLTSKRSETFPVKIFLKKYIKLLLALIVAPILGVFIVIGTWPYFWSDPVHKIERIVDFYKTIGTTVSIEQGFIGPFGINTYALQWILYTTPLVILFLAIVGVVVIFSKRFKEKNMQSLFFLLMLIVPIARITWPGMNIYGGVRQIMEYIPALAIIAGIGGASLRSWIRLLLNRLKMGKHWSSVFASVLVLAFFIPITLKLVEIHPNENVYFNPLIGGLKGAMMRDFPGWGISFGAPYREAIDWINRNVEPAAKLTLGDEILSNIPGIFIRPDIDYKRNSSGYLRQGEYVISLRFDGTNRRSYFDMYLDRMIKPLYEISVDGVPILRIWKNDKTYLKPEWENEGVLDDLKFTKSDNGISFDIGQQVKLSRLEMEYDDSNCPELSWGYLMLSRDGQVWERTPGVLPEEVRIRTLGIQPANGKFIEPFAGQVARYINFFVSPGNTCVTQIKSLKLYYFI